MPKPFRRLVEWIRRLRNVAERLRFELVALPRGKKATPLAELEAVFEHARRGKDVVRALQGTKWERYELTTPHRGAFKKVLEAWLAKQLPGIRRS